MNSNEPILITLTLQDDTIMECEVIELKEINSIVYVAVKSVETGVIYLYEKVDNEDDFSLKAIDDDMTFNKVKNHFLKGKDDTTDSGGYPADEDCDLDTYLKKYGFYDRRRQIIPKVKQSIVLKQDSNSSGLGESKLGGAPDITNDFIWPTINERHLDFLAQINLNDCSILDVEDLLPSKGMIYFFIDADELCNFSDGSKHKVIYKENIDEIKPSLINLTFSETPAKLIKRYTFPELEELHLDLDEEGYEEYSFDDMTTCIYGDTQILGYSSIIIDDPLQTIKANSDYDDWMLLFQVDSLYKSEISYLKSSMLYFLIRRFDLTQRNFDNVLLVKHQF